MMPGMTPCAGCGAYPAGFWYGLLGAAPRWAAPRWAAPPRPPRPPYPPGQPLQPARPVWTAQRWRPAGGALRPPEFSARQPGLAGSQLLSRTVHPAQPAPACLAPCLQRRRWLPVPTQSSTLRLIPPRPPQLLPQPPAPPVGALPAPILCSSCVGWRSRRCPPPRQLRTQRLQRARAGRLAGGGAPSGGAARRRQRATLPLHGAASAACWWSYWTSSTPC